MGPPGCVVCGGSMPPGPNPGPRCGSRGSPEKGNRIQLHGRINFQFKFPLTWIKESCFLAEQALPYQHTLVTCSEAPASSFPASASAASLLIPHLLSHRYPEPPFFPVAKSLVLEKPGLLLLLLRRPIRDVLLGLLLGVLIQKYKHCKTPSPQDFE